MACIDLDFEKSKKLLVFFACANPKFFKNYVQIYPARRPPFTPASYAARMVYSPAPANWDPNYYNAVNYPGLHMGNGVAYGYGDTIHNRDQWYGCFQPMEGYPDYVRFVPPTRRFPDEPIQLPRRYPPKAPEKPPSPVVVDATHPADLGVRAGDSASGTSDTDSGPVIRDVTPPPRQGQAATSGHSPTRQAGAKSQTTKKSKQRKHRRKTGSNKVRESRGKKRSWWW